MQSFALAAIGWLRGFISGGHFNSKGWPVTAQNLGHAGGAGMEAAVALIRLPAPTRSLMATD